jgi:hypothetical protein
MLRESMHPPNQILPLQFREIAPIVQAGQCPDQGGCPWVAACLVSAAALPAKI